MKKLTTLLLASIISLTVFGQASGIWSRVYTSGTDAYTAPAPSGFNNTLVDGSRFHVAFVNENTSTVVTLTIGSASAKSCYNAAGVSLEVGQLSGGGTQASAYECIATYNAALNGFKITGGSASGGGGETTAWGNIPGTLSDQTDLQNALNAKQATLVSLTNIRTVEGNTLLGTTNIDLSKSDVGLGNNDNTSDAAKPVSTLQQAALDLKANLASPTFTGVPIVPTASANTNNTQAASTAYADAKVVDGTITNGVTTTASSQDDLFDALALKADITSVELKALSFNTQTSDYTLVLSDGSSTEIRFNKSSAGNLTVPSNSSVAFPVGTKIPVKRTHASGALTFVQGGSVVITSSSGTLTDAGLNQLMYLIKTGTDTWDLENGAPGIWQSWVPTFGANQFSAAPTGVDATYYVIGKLVFIRIFMTSGTAGGASATAFTITNLPFPARVSEPTRCLIVDNDAAVEDGRANFNTGSSTLTFQVGASGGAFTGSGSKGAFVNTFYEAQ